MTKMQPLRDEHRELWPRVEGLRSIADTVGQIDPSTLRRDIDHAWEFLNRDLIPHAAAEDSALYPAVQRIMGASMATATMSRDHVAIARLIQDLNDARQKLPLENLSTDDANELRRIFYGLHALLKVHFAKEEEIYLPLLEDRLTEQEAEVLFEHMERAAQDARARRGHAA